MTEEITMTAPNPKAIGDEDRMRADLYNFLGVILSRPADEMLLAQTKSLTGDDSELGQAIKARMGAATDAS